MGKENIQPERKIKTREERAKVEKAWVEKSFPRTKRNLFCDFSDGKTRLFMGQFDTTTCKIAMATLIGKTYPEVQERLQKTKEKGYDKIKKEREDYWRK